MGRSILAESDILASCSPGSLATTYRGWRTSQPLPLDELEAPPREARVEVARKLAQSVVHHYVPAYIEECIRQPGRGALFVVTRSPLPTFWWMDPLSPRFYCPLDRQLLAVYATTAGVFMSKSGDGPLRASASAASASNLAGRAANSKHLQDVMRSQIKKYDLKREVVVVILSDPSGATLPGDLNSMLRSVAEAGWTQAEWDARYPGVPRHFAASMVVALPAPLRELARLAQERPGPSMQRLPSGGWSIDLDRCPGWMPTSVPARPFELQPSRPSAPLWRPSPSGSGENVPFKLLMCLSWTPLRPEDAALRYHRPQAEAQDFRQTHDAEETEGQIPEGMADAADEVTPECFRDPLADIMRDPVASVYFRRPRIAYDENNGRVWLVEQKAESGSDIPRHLRDDIRLPRAGKVSLVLVGCIEDSPGEAPPPSRGQPAPGDISDPRCHQPGAFVQVEGRRALVVAAMTSSYDLTSLKVGQTATLTMDGVRVTSRTAPSAEGGPVDRSVRAVALGSPGCGACIAVEHDDGKSLRLAGPAVVLDGPGATGVLASAAIWLPYALLWPVPGGAQAHTERHKRMVSWSPGAHHKAASVVATPSPSAATSVSRRPNNTVWRRQGSPPYAKERTAKAPL